MQAADAISHVRCRARLTNGEYWARQLGFQMALNFRIAAPLPLVPALVQALHTTYLRAERPCGTIRSSCGEGKATNENHSNHPGFTLDRFQPDAPVLRAAGIPPNQRLPRLPAAGTRRAGDSLLPGRRRSGTRARHSHFSAYLRAAGLDELHTSIQDAGLAVEPPSARPWGMKEMEIIDPDGSLLRFGEALEG